MLELKNNKLIIDGVEKNLKDINLIIGNENTISFSSNLVERIKEYPYSILDLYAELTKTGLKSFWLTNNKIINLNNIERVYIKYYQYAGLSIIETIKSNAEKCNVNIVCKNGKTESVSFSSDKEAEKFYHELDNKIMDIKSEQIRGYNE